MSIAVTSQDGIDSKRRPLLEVCSVLGESFMFMQFLAIIGDEPESGIARAGHLIDRRRLQRVAAPNRVSSRRIGPSSWIFAQYPGMDFFGRSWLGAATGYADHHHPMHELGVAMLLVEHNQWLLSLSGRFGVYPGEDTASFIASVAQLPVPEMFETLNDAPATTSVAAWFLRHEVKHCGDGTPVGLLPVDASFII